MLTADEIVEGYNRAYPDRPPLVHSHGWIYGVWMVGNDYRNKSSLYGAYPRSLLERYEACFGWPEKVLHIFSGSLPADPRYTRIDIEREADIQGDVQQLSELVEAGWDLIYADPPYTPQDAEVYGTPMPKKFSVVKECAKVLKPGGLLVWLDTQWPMFRKKELTLIGTIGLIRSTNHRVRGVFIFRRNEEERG